MSQDVQSLGMGTGWSLERKEALGIAKSISKEYLVQYGRRRGQLLTILSRLCSNVLGI